MGKPIKPAPVVARAPKQPRNRANGLYGLMAQPAPEGAPPASMSMADALAIAVRKAESHNPIDYAYIHALNAAALRLDHTRLDDLARSLQRLLDASAGYDSCSIGQQAEFDAAQAEAEELLKAHRGISR